MAPLSRRISPVSGGRQSTLLTFGAAPRVNGAKRLTLVRALTPADTVPYKKPTFKSFPARGPKSASCLRGGGRGDGCRSAG